MNKKYEIRDTDYIGKLLDCTENWKYCRTVHLEGLDVVHKDLDHIEIFCTPYKDESQAIYFLMDQEEYDEHEEELTRIINYFKER